MNFLICVSHVPDTTTKIQFEGDGKKLSTPSITWIPGPYEDYALSRALEIKEADKTSKITVVSVGDKSVETSMRKAYALGADEGTRIDATSDDAFFIASQIAEFVKSHPTKFDLIMLGKETIDGNTGEIPGMLAELLNVPCVTFVSSLEIEGNNAIVKREVDGAKEELEVPMPAVLAVQKGIAEWRIPNVKGIMSSKTKPLKVIPAFEAETMLQIVTHEMPPAKAGCQMIDAGNIQALISILADKGVI